MKLTAIFRRTSKVDDDLSNFHRVLLACTTGLSNGWDFGLSGSPEIQPGELVSVCKFTGNGKLKGEVCYTLRSELYLRDKSQHDDSVSIELSVDEKELMSFYDNVFTKVIDAFGAYRAEVTVPSLARQDWREIAKATKESGRDVYGRYGVYRIWPISYYRKSLLNGPLRNGLYSEYAGGVVFCQPKAYFNNEYETFSGKVLSS